MCHPARRQRSRHQLMSGAERSFVTVGFSWTLAKGFLQGERRAEFSRGSPRAGKGACEDGAASDDLGETPKALAEEARLRTEPRAPPAAVGEPWVPVALLPSTSPASGSVSEAVRLELLCPARPLAEMSPRRAGEVGQRGIFSYLAFQQ